MEKMEHHFDFVKKAEQVVDGIIYPSQITLCWYCYEVRALVLMEENGIPTKGHITILRRGTGVCQ